MIPLTAVSSSRRSFTTGICCSNVNSAATGFCARPMSASQSRHLLESLELNPAVYKAGQTRCPPMRAAPSSPTAASTQATQDINSGFHSLQLTAQKRFSTGFTVLANYTWSKSIDDLPADQGITGVSAGSNSPIPWNFPGPPSSMTGVPRSSITHIASSPLTSGLFRKLAHANTVIATVAGGWQLTGIFTAADRRADHDPRGQGPIRQQASARTAPTISAANPYGAAPAAAPRPCVNYLNPAAFAHCRRRARSATSAKEACAARTCELGYRHLQRIPAA